MMPSDPAQAKAKARARLRRGMFMLPSLFTVGNIAAGFFSITQTMMALTGAGDAHTHLDWAAIAVIFAIPFDALDGRIARMTNTCSDFGKELDSLADAITFGVAPSLLALIWGFHFLSDTMNPQLHEHLLYAGAFICFLFLIGGVSRLARFNISHDPSRAIRDGRTASTLWACRFRRRRACWPLRCISAAATRCMNGGWRSSGLESSA
jgi:CDP-diacylglycerol--serine O-phosphatidyltransferase